MKIAIICDVLGEANNGTTLAAMNLISRLKKKGHDVRVVSPDKNTQGKDGYFVVPTLNLGKYLNGVVAKNGVSLAKVDEDVLRTALDGVDVVHLLTPFTLSKAALRLAKERGIPVSASFHCQAENITSHIGCMNIPAVNKLIYKGFYKKVFSHCDVVHFPTQFIKDTFKEATGADVNSCVISNGVNDAFFMKTPEQEKPEKFTVVCTGRYSKEKSQATLIDAIALSQYKENIRVIFAGAGPMEAKLRRRAAKKGVDCEFRFFTRDKLRQMLQTADLYVHTAVIEIEAIACLEAIVSGLVPVICNSKRSATRYFAIDECGLYKEGDPADLCKKIEFFYREPKIKEAYALAYKEKCCAFDQGECMSKMEEMLLSLVEKRV